MLNLQYNYCDYIFSFFVYHFKPWLHFVFAHGFGIHSGLGKLLSFSRSTHNLQFRILNSEFHIPVLLIIYNSEF